MHHGEKNNIISYQELNCKMLHIGIMKTVCKNSTLNPILFWTDRLKGGCPDGVSCDYAHSPEELAEWKDRRDFLRQKLAKAREDKLVKPDEVDFGNYNFLLND